MPLVEGGVRDVKEISSRFNAISGHNMVTAFDSDDNITAMSYYDDGGNLLISSTYELASFKSICTTVATTGWDHSGDCTDVAVTAGGWMNATTSVLTGTYTDSTHAGALTCTTDNGDCHDWLGATAVTGYVICFIKFSDFANVTSVELRIGSGAGNYRSVTLYTDIDYQADDKWFYLLFDLSAGTTPSGAADATNLEYLSFNFVFAAGTTQTVDIHSIMLAGISATQTGETFRDMFRATNVYSIEGKTIYDYYITDNTQTIFGTLTRSGY